MVFDFDKTILEVDSDNWVVDELGATAVFDQLLHTMPWNTLMVCLIIITVLVIFVNRYKILFGPYSTGLRFQNDMLLNNIFSFFIFMNFILISITG